MKYVITLLCLFVLMVGCASQNHTHIPVDNAPYINSVKYIGSGIYDIDFNAVELQKKISGATAGMVNDSVSLRSNADGSVGLHRERHLALVLSQSHWDDILHEFKPYVLQWASTHSVEITTIRALLDGKFMWEIYNE